MNNVQTSVQLAVRVTSLPERLAEEWSAYLSAEQITELYSNLLRDELRAFLRGRAEVIGLTVTVAGVILSERRMG